MTKGASKFCLQHCSRSNNFTCLYVFVCAVKEARLKEIRHEILTSERLKVVVFAIFVVWKKSSHTCICIHTSVTFWRQSTWLSSPETWQGSPANSSSTPPQACTFLFRWVSGKLRSTFPLWCGYWLHAMLYAVTLTILTILCYALFDVSFLTNWHIIIIVCITLLHAFDLCYTAQKLCSKFVKS